MGHIEKLKWNPQAGGGWGWGKKSFFQPPPSLSSLSPISWEPFGAAQGAGSFSLIPMEVFAPGFPSQTGCQQPLLPTCPHPAGAFRTTVSCSPSVVKCQNVASTCRSRGGRGWLEPQGCGETKPSAGPGHMWVPGSAVALPPPSPPGPPPSPRSLSRTCALGAYLQSRSLVLRLSPQTGGVLHHRRFWRQGPLPPPSPRPCDWSLERRPLGSLDVAAPMDTPDGAHAFLCASQSPQVSDQIMDLKHIVSSLWGGCGVENSPPHFGARISLRGCRGFVLKGPLLCVDQLPMSGSPRPSILGLSRLPLVALVVVSSCFLASTAPTPHSCPRCSPRHSPKAQSQPHYSLIQSCQRPHCL